MAITGIKREKSSIITQYRDLKSASDDELSPCNEKTSLPYNDGYRQRRRSITLPVILTVLGLLIASAVAIALFLGHKKAPETTETSAAVSLLQKDNDLPKFSQTTIEQQGDNPSQAPITPQPTPLDFLTCGSSPEEASALGCKFDIMTFGWLHPDCFNGTMSREWELKWGPWEWRFQKNETETIPYDHLHWQKVVWGPQGYHVVHCLYSFKLVHLAGINGYMLSDEAGPLSHTDHCIETIAHPKTLDAMEVNTRIRNLYTRCVKLK